MITGRVHAARWLLTASAVLVLSSALAQTPQRQSSRKAESTIPVSDAYAAAREFEAEATRKPREAMPKVQAAKAYASVGDVTASRRAATEALARDERNVEAMQLLARLSARELKWDDAASLLRRAVALDPNNASAQLALGHALEKLGDQTGSDAAYAAYRSLRGMKPLPTPDSANVP